jgi:hypothetical protein
LLTLLGKVHNAPETDIDERGSIIVRPGYQHECLGRNAFQKRKVPYGSGTFGFVQDSRSFDLSQAVKSDQQHMDAVANGQLTLAKLLYPRLNPRCGWIDESGENEPSIKSIAATELKYLLWANFYGPDYVAQYGRAFLMKAPGFIKEELDNGGILYVVTESYVEWYYNSAPEAVEYFRKKVPTIRCYKSRGFERMEETLATPSNRRKRNGD